MPAIIADNDDPEHRHRVKVIIPHIDENIVHDEWVERMGGYAGSGGYGSFEIPRVGTEVVLFSEWGAGERLFYMTLFNEQFTVPPDFTDETVRGTRVDGDYKLIVEGDLYFRAGRVKIESDSSVDIIAPAGVFQRSGGEEEEE